MIHKHGYQVNHLIVSDGDWNFFDYNMRDLGILLSS